MPTITEIETAMIARLRERITYLRTCGSMAEFLADDIENIEEYAPLCPAAFVVYDSGSYSHKVSGRQDREMVFNVLVVVRNLRGETAARHGVAGEKGVYDVLDDVRATLTDQSCGLAMDPLLPMSEEGVAGSKDLAIYAIAFKTRCRFTL
ncbi:MAG: Gp37 family protein [Syntrophobacteraceae bacterium]